MLPTFDPARVGLCDSTTFERRLMTPMGNESLKGGSRPILDARAGVRDVRDRSFNGHRWPREVFGGNFFYGAPGGSGFAPTKTSTDAQ